MTFSLFSLCRLIVCTRLAKFTLYYAIFPRPEYAAGPMTAIGITFFRQIFYRVI